MLKRITFFLVCAWIGAGISMLLLGFLKGKAPNGDELATVNYCIKLIDDLIIIPVAMGTLIFGILPY